MVVLLAVSQKSDFPPSSQYVFYVNAFILCFYHELWSLKFHIFLGTR